MKFLDPLPRPAVAQPYDTTGGLRKFRIEMRQINHSFYAGWGQVPVWTYVATDANGNALHAPHYLGPTFDETQGVPAQVQFEVKLPPTHIFAVDPTLPDTKHGEPPVRGVVHRHGGHQHAKFDGVPHAWYTPDGENGIDHFKMHHPELADQFPADLDDYKTNVYRYDNTQHASTLWYHDHASGVTRLNVYAGLAGFYLSRDAVENNLNLPKGNYEVGLAIQDRNFCSDGSLSYPDMWMQHFHGNTAVVNGKAWPYLNVEPRKYRFRVLNGSNGRRYSLAMRNLRTGASVPFYQIGTELGFSGVVNKTGEFSLTSGERLDVLVDFAASGVLPGDEILLINKERGDGPDLVEIMKFTVGNAVTSTANNRFPTLPARARIIPPANARERTVRLEKLKEDGRAIFLLNGKHFSDRITDADIVRSGDIEIWNVINLHTDTHPVHLHLSDFEILDRQAIDGAAWKQALTANPGADFRPFLTGSRQPPRNTEVGLKDTFMSSSMTVTRIAVKYSNYSGDTVWHCHILEHEDNDMMRPLRVLPN